MSSALLTVFDAHVAQLILDFVPEDRDPELETVYGSVVIDGVKHLQTYGGGPEGGYVYFWTRRDRGWYRWHRTWGTEATYEKVEDGEVAFFFSDDGSEYIKVIDKCWSFWEAQADTVIVANDDWMRDTTPEEEQDDWEEEEGDEDET